MQKTEIDLKGLQEKIPHLGDFANAAQLQRTRVELLNALPALLDEIERLKSGWGEAFTAGVYHQDRAEAAEARVKELEGERDAALAKIAKVRGEGRPLADELIDYAAIFIPFEKGAGFRLRAERVLAILNAKEPNQ